MPPSYKIDEHPLNYVNEIKYLGVVMQSNLKFNRRKVNSAKKVLGCIKYALNGAPQPAQLLAYSSLCRPIFEYVNILWGPADAASIQEHKAVQNRVLIFFKSIKEKQGITEERTALRLHELKDRRKSYRFALMTKILSDDEKLAVLFSVKL